MARDRHTQHSQHAGQGHKQTKIKKYRKPLNINIGMVIFVVVFIYMAYFVVGYFQYSPPKPYEVKEGSLSVNNMFHAMALRKESVVLTQTAGYMNYYVREGERVASGNLVYTVDETGRLNEYMESINLGENSLSSAELAQFRSDIVDFVHGFDPVDFGSAYDFKYSIKGTVLRLANEDMLQNLSQNTQDFSDTIQICYAPDTGIVTYWTDGYETLEPGQITADIFEKVTNGTYEKNQLLGTSLAAVGDPAYKLSTSEEWSIVIPVDLTYGQRLLEEEYVKVRFLKNQMESWGKVTLWNNLDGNHYAQLTFTNSMVSFVGDRFLEVELVLNEQSGLKIPNSSIAEREFFLVPKRFVDAQDGSSVANVLIQTFDEDGNISGTSTEVDVYSYDEEAQEYYLDSQILQRGDVLHKLDGQETFTVSKSATLIGVYNMNKGYADFKEIEILAQNDEYAIVKSNTRYGLNVYDNIVLDASSVVADDFVFE